MPTTLPQLELWQWVLIGLGVILVAGGLILYARRRRFRLSKLEVTGGPVKASFEPDKTADTAGKPGGVQDPSVNISGNTFLGRTRADIRREKTNLSGNLTVGDTDISVGAKPGPKPKRTTRRSGHKPDRK